MRKEIKLLVAVLGTLLGFQACSSPDKKEVRGDSVVNVGEGMDVKRDTGFNTTTNKQTGEKEEGNSTTNITHESHIDDDGAAFMKAAALGGMMEVELGKVAQQSANAEVKAFGEQMVKDHTLANNALKKLAFESEILLPTAYPADQRDHIQMMKKLKGKEFDQHYVAMMVEDHQKTLALFKRGGETRSKKLKAYVAKTLPVLEDHYKKAKSIQASLNR